MNINEITIKYKINNDEKLRIFGDIFIKNNKNNFQMYINKNRYELNNIIDIKNLKTEKNILEIKLNEINKISDISFMFDDCTSLISVSCLDKIEVNQINNMRLMFNNCNNLYFLSGISK